MSDFDNKFLNKKRLDLVKIKNLLFSFSQHFLVVVSTALFCLEDDGHADVLLEKVLLEVVAPVLGGHVGAGLDPVGGAGHLAGDPTRPVHLHNHSAKILEILSLYASLYFKVGEKKKKTGQESTFAFTECTKWNRG